MSIDYAGIMQDLFNGGIIIAGVVSKASGEIVYTSSNWSVEQKDLTTCIRGWQNKGQFVMLQGIKYSMLLSLPEYFSAVNYKEKSWLIGAGSPEENGERYYVIGYAPAGVDGKNAYVDVARAANRMKTSGSFVDPSKQFGKAVDGAAAGVPATSAAKTPAPARSAVDPALKQEIDSFIQWIKDPNGLAGYISYYIQSNDPNILAKLAKAYNDFRTVFGF
jgi:hypothetical protein